MAKGHDHEIRDHAVIATLLAMAAALCESAKDWLPALLPVGYPSGQMLTWSGLVATPFIGVFVFLIIYKVDQRLSRNEERLVALQREQPIHLERAGQIDGFWIDVVWRRDGGSIVVEGGSVLSIASKGRAVFTITGEFYDCTSLEGPEVALAWNGYWAGTGYTYGEDGFVYTYVGGEGAGDRHHGIGNYDFRVRPADEASTAFTGQFLADAVGEIRNVTGRRVHENDVPAFKADKGETLLRAFLTEWVVAKRRTMPIRLSERSVALAPGPAARGQPLPASA